MSLGRQSVNTSLLLAALVAAPLAAQARPGSQPAPPAPTPRQEPSRPAEPARPTPEPVKAKPAADPNAPKEGTWGAEATSASLDVRAPSANLLRFMSPSLAIVVGGGALVGSGDDVSNAFNLRLGVRRFAVRSGPIRPIIGGGLIANVIDQGGDFGNDTSLGLYGEAGAAYFFSPHFSLGAVGEVNITQDNNLGQNTVRFRGTLARLIAAVYF